MDKEELDYIRRRAAADIQAEDFRAAVELEKQRLRRKRSFWQRLFGWLPFTIVRKNHVSD